MRSLTIFQAFSLCSIYIGAVPQTPTNNTIPPSNPESNNLASGGTQGNSSTPPTVGSPLPSLGNVVSKSNETTSGFNTKEPTGTGSINLGGGGSSSTGTSTDGSLTGGSGNTTTNAPSSNNTTSSNASPNTQTNTGNSSSNGSTTGSDTTSAGMLNNRVQSIVVGITIISMLAWII